MSTAPPVLDVDVAHLDEACVIRIQGELDIATAPTLESALLHALDSEAASIFLDLGRVRFIDSMGLRVLVWAARESREDGKELAVVVADGQVRKLLYLTAIDQSIRVFPALDDAVAFLGANGADGASATTAASPPTNAGAPSRSGA